MSIGLKSDSSGTSGSIVVNGSDAVLVTPTGITTASIQDSSITFSKLSTSATEANNVASRTAKAWVNFNGTGTVAIRASFNVSSITDGGTGTYAINFAAALTDANYAWSGAATTSGDSNLVQGNNTPVNPTASILSIQVLNAGIALKDSTYVTVAVFR